VTDPRVTIGVPVYNGERYLAEALESLIAQDYDDIEIVISDNASTDGTWQICEKYAALDSRIRLYRNEQNLGAADNHTRVVELARGELFKWMHYDDRCAPAYISRCVAALDEAGPRAVLAHPRTFLIDEGGTITGKLAEDLDLRSPLPWTRVAQFIHNKTWCSTFLGVVRTDVLRRTGLIRPFYWSDHALVVELAVRGEIHGIPEWLYFHRIYKNSIHENPNRNLRRRSAEIAYWFDTRSSRRNFAPKMRLRAAMLEAIVNSDLDPAVKARCAAVYLAAGSARFVEERGDRVKRRLLGRPPIQSPGW
jgi:glycosyltransferase involved in cell wall biosynthesis